MKKKSVFLSFLALIVLLITIAACNRNTDKEGDSPEAVYTEAALTVAAQLTKIAEENQELEATTTPEDIEEPEATATSNDAQPTATEASGDPTATKAPTTQSGNCTLKADYVTDITVSDGTVLAPGESFTKTWQIMNSGTCVWGDGYTVYFQGGDNLSAPESTSLTHGISVAEGTLINVSVNLTAPSIEGEYTANFLFKDPSGKVFGIGSNGSSPVYVNIVVAKPTATPTKTAVPTNTPLPTETPTPDPTATP